MFASAKSSKAFRVIATALAAALTTCAVAVSTNESPAPASVQVAEQTPLTPMDDGFHW